MIIRFLLVTPIHSSYDHYTVSATNAIAIAITVNSQFCHIFQLHGAQQGFVALEEEGALEADDGARERVFLVGKAVVLFVHLVWGFPSAPRDVELLQEGFLEILEVFDLVVLGRGVDRVDRRPVVRVGLPEHERVQHGRGVVGIEHGRILEAGGSLDLLVQHLGIHDLFLAKAVREPADVFPGGFLGKIARVDVEQQAFRGTGDI